MDENMRALMARLEELIQNVHQYVGARYVPRFIDEPWSDINEYEALDVVDNGTGTSYIAKKPVPVGTPLSDRNYWFVYGSTSGAIINLQNQIDEIQDGSVSGSIQNQINQQDERIEALEDVHERYFLCIGDSYAAGSGVTTSFWEQAGIMLGVDNDHWISTAVTSFGFGDGSWLTNTMDWVANNPDTAAKITDIFILGGYNDSGYTIAQLQTPIENLINYIKTNFSHLRNIYCSCIGWSANTDRTVAKRLAKQTRPGYRTVTSRGVNYIYDLENAFHNYEYYQSDNIHPNQTGHNQAAYLLSQYIRTGSCKSVRPLGRSNMGISWTGCLPESNKDHFVLDMVGDKITFQVCYTTKFTAYADLSNNALICSIAANTGCLLGTGYISIDCSINNTPAQIIIDADKIYLRLPSGMTIANHSEFYISCYAVLDASDC